MARPTVEDTVAELEENLSFFDEEDDRYRWLMELGRELEPLAPGEMVEANRVTGCQSRVWLVSGVEDGRLRFRAASDAAFVQGVLAMLLRIFDDRLPEEILEADPGFLGRLGLSLSRRNGAHAVFGRMASAARAVQAAG
ncbi:SufE family protein [Sabulicella glaciei]|uniref:SufE family protein n=1 Tax=Sabulicella glaciei TaxID=2984948 RepID=A0ABT3P171_9PROT|nr:SufE family protein [Roseococcus sp. MDT2-1-1]MCW8088152.1 SufE family protein [Roseococcus sp. MDT2-1-1]